MVSSMYHVSDD